jgi:tetratricopeptide (TPR) repeat protein
MATFSGGMNVGGDLVAGDKIIQPSGVPDPPRQLPLDVPDFTGRTEILAQLGTLVGDDRMASSPIVVTIAGMPGVGKTALAVHWAHLMSERFPDGHLFINLHGFGDRAALPPHEALGQALRALGVSAGHIPADEDEMAALYRSQLAAKRFLIVLDDAAAYGQVRPLLPGGSSCLVVVTSRNDLVELVARHGARTVVLDALPDSEATDLVRAVAGRERTESEPEATAELVRLCARLPLALRIVAANLAIRPRQTVADTVRALAGGDRLSSLTLDEHMGEAVRLSFELSYRGLNTESKRAFRFLGLIDGPTFTPEATGALLAVAPAAARRLLHRLAAANLVQAVSDHRYQLHELLREYARERTLDEDDRLVRESAVQRLAVWYLAAAQHAGRCLDRYRRTIRHELPALDVDVDQAERARQIEWFTVEHRNLAAVVRQIADTRWDQLTWELADAVYDFYQLRRYCRENIALHRLGLLAAERSDHLPAQFFMRHHIAVGYRELGDYPEAFTQARIALELSRRVQDGYGGAVVLDSIARIHLAVGECRAAMNVAKEALATRRQIGDRHGEAATLDTLARAYQGLSRFQAALDHAERALRIRREIGDRRGEAETLDSLARTHHGRGETAFAIDHAERALTIHRQIDDRYGEAETLAFLGNLHVRLGRYLYAHDYVRRALEIRRSIMERQGEGEDLVYLSTILRRLGRYDEAVHSALQALDILQELGDRRGESMALDSLGRAYRRKRFYDEARVVTWRAYKLSRMIGDRHSMGTVLQSLALLDRRQGRLRAARRHATRSFRIGMAIGDRFGEGSALDTLAKIYWEMGLPEKAYRTAHRALSTGQEIDHEFGQSVTLLSLGEICADLGRHEESLSHLEAAYELQDRIGDSYGKPRTLRALARTLRSLARVAEARTCEEEAERLDHEKFLPQIV